MTDINNNDEQQDNNGQEQNPSQNDNNFGQILSPMEPFLHAINKISENVQNFVDKKYKHDYTGQIIYGCIVFVILATIVILALEDKITETAIGTLLGTTIGYAIGKFSQNKSGSSKE